jgi:hypothetical protein
MSTGDRQTRASDRIGTNPLDQHRESLCEILAAFSPVVRRAMELELDKAVVDTTNDLVNSQARSPASAEVARALVELSVHANDLSYFLSLVRTVSTEAKEIGIQ